MNAGAGGRVCVCAGDCDGTRGAVMVMLCVCAPFVRAQSGLAPGELTRRKKDPKI